LKEEKIMKFVKRKCCPGEDFSHFVEGFVGVSEGRMSLGRLGGRENLQ
jgi:hypothetical protein